MWWISGTNKGSYSIQGTDYEDSEASINSINFYFKTEMKPFHNRKFIVVVLMMILLSSTHCKSTTACSKLRVLVNEIEQEPEQSAINFCTRQLFYKLGKHSKMVETVETKSIVTASQTPAEHPVHHVDTPFEKITFGMGCFWGCDCLFGATRGVLRTRVGYAAGTTVNPTYKNIGDHTEVIEIDYDPEVITFQELMDLFWNNHEYGLATKIKTQYCSLILYHNEQQKKLAEVSKAEEQEKRPNEKITTRILKAGTFYPAEDYHQKYRLQSHKNLAKALKLDSNLLQTSHVAARLNGYLVGVGGIAQFLKEANDLGLTSEQRDYVMKHVKENEGGGLFC